MEALDTYEYQSYDEIINLRLAKKFLKSPQGSNSFSNISRSLIIKGIIKSCPAG